MNRILSEIASTISRKHCKDDCKDGCGEGSSIIWILIILVFFLGGGGGLFGGNRCIPCDPCKKPVNCCNPCGGALVGTGVQSGLFGGGFIWIIIVLALVFCTGDGKGGRRGGNVNTNVINVDTDDEDDYDDCQY